MAAKKDFTAKNLHEYVDSYLKSYYEVEDKDAAADANMQTQDIKTGDASKKEDTEKDKYLMKKDGFREGEYSIYLGKPKKGTDEVYGSYIFGITKKDEAQAVVDYLNKITKE